MFKHRALSICVLALAVLTSVPGPAQQTESGSEEEKRRRFLKSREVIQPEPRPAGAPSPSAKPKPKPHQTSTPHTPAKSPPAREPKREPAPAPRQPSKKPSRPQEPPKPAQAPPKDSPATPPAAPSLPLKTGEEQEAPVVIEKSGILQETSQQKGFFFGWFTKWKYLSKSVRDQIDRAPVQKARWKYIVVHNSGTRQGSAKAFDYYHKQIRKMPNGLAYQFVIGNGTSSGDGQIEVGSRWNKQINGGHVHSDYLNSIALGICLVGDFNQDKPTAKQLEALDELIRYLRQRVGKNEGRWAIVKAHKEINPPQWPTDCPGGEFPYRWLHNRFD